MVKVLVVSDEVAHDLQPGRLRELAPGLVLAGGDLPWDYLEYLASCVDAPFLFVPGNHDPDLDRRAQRGDQRARFDAEAHDGPRPHGARNIDQQVVLAAGLRVAGLGGCVRYREGPHQYTQAQYARRARRLLRRYGRSAPVDILLTHAPPLGLGDGEDLAHQGIEALHGVLERLRPTWHLHGHVHPYGLTLPDRHVGGTTIRNVIPWRMLDVTPRTAGVQEASPRPVGQ